MERANQAIRTKIAEAGLCHWQIAEAIGRSEFTFCRMLRRELAPDTKAQIEKAICKLQAQNSEARG